MTDVAVTAKPDLVGKRLAFALAEDRIGHYAEFRDYFVRIFDLDRVGLAEPGFVQAPSGLVSPPADWFSTISERPHLTRDS